MLPPIIPLSAAPVTSQQDPVKQTPPIPPVVPAQPSSSDGTIDLRHQRDPQEQALLLREEQRRQQQQRQQKVRTSRSAPCRMMSLTPTTLYRYRRWASDRARGCWWISKSELVSIGVRLHHASLCCQSSLP